MKKLLIIALAVIATALAVEPNGETVSAKLSTVTSTNTATIKVVDGGYGCLVYGCTQDHTTTYWKRTTTVLKTVFGEINGEKFQLSSGIISQTTTNYYPKETPEGMIFEARAK